MPKLTVCGGGNGAHVLMALGPEVGWEVDVFAPLADESARLQAGIDVSGGITADFGDRTVTGRPRRVSPDPADVIPGSELILMTLPAFAHGVTLQAIAPYLDPGAVVGALPARSGFDYQALHILSDRQPAARLFGLQTLPWACRITRYGESVEVLGTKAVVDVAVAPTDIAASLVTKLTALLNLTLRPVSSFLALSLANTGQLIHPGIMYGLCRGKESATYRAVEVPLFYQGVDQTTADVLQAMSDEVQAIARAVAARRPNFDPQEVPSLYDWILQSYANDIADSSTLRAAFNTNRAYTGLRVPSRPAGPDLFETDFSGRYLAEDVPFGLVVLRGIAELATVSTPAIDRVILWAQAQLAREYLVGDQLGGADLPGSRAPQVYGLQTLAQLIS